VIGPLIVSEVDFVWIIIGLAEAALFLLFVRSIGWQQRRQLWTVLLVVAFFGLWRIIELLHFDFAFDFLLNTALMTAFLVAAKLSSLKQSLYTACVFSISTEIGKILSADVCLQPFYAEVSKLPPLVVTVLWALLYLLFTAAILLLIRRWTFSTCMRQLSWSEVVFLLIPLVPYTIIRHGSYIYSMDDFKLYLNMLVLLLLLSFCTLANVVFNARHLATRIEKNYLLHQDAFLKMQYDQYLIQKETIDAVNIRYHDLKHFLSDLKAVHAPADNEPFDDIEEFINAVNNEIDPLNYSIQTGNEVLDVFLSRKKMGCLKRGIRPLFYVDGQRLGFINSVDLCALFGNAVDNAIEATAVLVDDSMREIGLSVTYHNQLAVINCWNNQNGQLTVSDDGMLKTSKRGFGGMGMRSMRDIAEKYGGAMSWKAENDHFNLSVIIPVPPEEHHCGERSSKAI
jgi:hypothetical protein